MGANKGHRMNFCESINLGGPRAGWMMQELMPGAAMDTGLTDQNTKENEKGHGCLDSL